MTSFFTKDPAQKEAFLKQLEKPRSIVLCCHQNPDGDAFGSSLGLGHILSNMGHQITIISPTEHSENLDWMPGVGDILNFEGAEKSFALEKIKKAELIFCLDFSTINRLKHAADPILNAKAPKVMIDHHQEPEDFASYTYWNEKASSTCELVYEMVSDLGWTKQMNKKAATCLYTGLVTDSGSFRFPSTTPRVHAIVADLLGYDIDHASIHRRLFDQQEMSRLRLMGYVLSEKLVYLDKYRTAYMSLSLEDLERFNFKQGDTEGLVNYGLSIKGAVMSAIFIEKEDLIKISFRSVHDFSVSALSRDHFSGGGHKNAAGGKSQDTLQNTLEKFKNLLPHYKELLTAQPQ